MDFFPVDVVHRAVDREAVVEPPCLAAELVVPQLVRFELIRRLGQPQGGEVGAAERSRKWPVDATRPKALRRGAIHQCVARRLPGQLVFGIDATLRLVDRRHYYGDSAAGLRTDGKSPTGPVGLSLGLEGACADG